jgi:hypothetical protein
MIAWSSPLKDRTGRLYVQRYADTGASRTLDHQSRQRYLREIGDATGRR